jgi:hypothetical protein
MGYLLSIPIFVGAGLTGISGIVALVFRFTGPRRLVIVHRFSHWPGQPPVIHWGDEHAA